ncbi:PQQ enzyme repeat family protein [Loa loa]|uniref:ER membrane protein complex subunit 1 n=1 Tax=Loa loa TaxID=7209 RepID=A0A1S0UK92_LOALO|nr:PQQ enzyme repeat family protein [Loa loa]EJD76132.1 PQQ enzyme repeat family protein [Loa loa]
MIALLLWFATVFTTISAIYEDQIGKFDWHHKYVGCARELHMERLKGTKLPHIFVSTEADMVASLKASTGQIAWRQQLERASALQLSFSPAAKLLITVTKENEVVRAWNRDSGVLVWETQIQQITPGWKKTETLISNDNVFVLRGAHITALSLGNGQLKWATNLGNIESCVGSVPGSQTITVVGGVEGAELALIQIDVTNGAVIKIRNLSANWFNPKKCILSDTLLQCFDNKGFYVVDLSLDPLTVHQTLLQSIVRIPNLNVGEVMVVCTLTNTYVYRVGLSESPLLLLKLEKIEAVSSHVATNGQNLLAVATSTNNIIVYDAVNGEQLFTGTIPEKDPAPIKLFSFIEISKEFEFAIVLEDCRFVYLVGSSNKLAREWIRHEALSTITSVEMVDLPLSEAQADIESEFASDDDTIMESLMRRLRSQMEQFRRACISVTNQIFSSNFLPFYSKSFADWITSFRFSSKRTRRKSVPSERDYFNLRKIIVVSTLKSIVYGIDSSDGTILWYFYLGKNIKPLFGSLGNEKIPLFIQRTTAHYHFSPQATVVASDKRSGYVALISFNPITGSLIERKNFPTSIKRVEILPYANAQTHIYHLIMVDKNNKITSYPENIDALEQQVPLHLFNFDASGNLEGFILNVTRKQLSSTWKVKLSLRNEQKIVAVVPKPSYQKVHSAGRVLGNRSVLYKYANPNLVAIAVLDSIYSVLQIYLVDAVSGYIVYSGKQNKITGPVHLIHCENWLAYSYWNEKGRRVEVAVVELYEGLEQTDPLHYNSLVHTLAARVTVLSQAYIFPQGVVALGVTETELGLSTRSLLVAMPFGGIYVISKRLLDARRPIEMTQELAEEMLLPYRPELPIASEDFINYNQSIHSVRDFKTSPSGLESTSLMLAYGTDLFFTQLTPSGTFDILKDDFDHLLISIVLVSLVIGSLVCKRLGKNSSLKQAWH